MKKVAILLGILLTTVVVTAIGFSFYQEIKDLKAEKVVIQPEPVTPESLLKYVNKERAKVGVAPLVLDERLNSSAKRKSDEMLSEDRMSHVNNRGVHGYTYAGEAMKECKFAGENLVVSDWGVVTNKGIMDSWVSSRPHYEGMINPRFTVTGFGISKNYITEHFCSLN